MARHHLWGKHKESLNRLVSEHTESVREADLLSPGSQHHFIQGWVIRRSEELTLSEICRRKCVQGRLMSMLWNHGTNENLDHWVRNWSKAKHKI